MAIKKEREAFLNVYVNYKGDSRKIQFNEETEQFMWRKNNVSDTEVEYVHLMNQQWYAWLACAKSKAQAVPEGFVLVEKKEFEQMQEFEDLYRRAIFNSKKSIHEVNWSHVSNLGVGSTRAKAMCKRFNIDPEATFRKPQEPTSG